MPIHVSSPKAQKIFSKLEKLSCPYSGEKLSIAETKKMNERLVPQSYDTEIFKNNPTEALNKYLKKLDEIIANNPTNLELRKYKAMIEKLKK